MSQNEEPDYIFKILLIGDAGVGKSSLMRRFSDDSYSEGNFSTIGVDFVIKRIKTIQVDGKVIKLQIWDTAGHERFRAVTYSYYRGAHGIILVYDITKKDTFINLPKWLEDVKKFAQPGVSLMIVGNKCDIADSRQVEQTAAEIFSRENEMQYLETSAKNASNVHQAFSMLSGIIKTRLQAKSEAERASFSNSPTISFASAKEIKPKRSCC